MPNFECKDLVKRFGGATALEGVSLKAEPGRVLGLLGPNGSGKTTLIKTACGLLQPTSGEIRICGRAPGTETKKLVSYLPDRMCLPRWMSAQQLVKYYADFFEDFDETRAGELLTRLDIRPEVRVKHMSKGTQEKVQLVLTMSRRAKLYLLDERRPRDARLHTLHDNDQLRRGRQRGDLHAPHLGRRAHTRRRGVHRPRPRGHGRRGRQRPLSRRQEHRRAFQGGVQMLGKLLKHEFKATGRVMLPFLGALLVLSVMVWLSINVFFSNFGGVSIIGGIVLTLYFMLLASIGIVTLVLLVYRFYRSFLSDEGYMTFSLPAGIHAQLGAKLISAAVWIVLTGILVVLSLLLTTSTLGEAIRLPWSELFARIYAESGIGAGSIIAIVLEVLLAVVLGALVSCLIFYASMSLGFGFSNHKLLYSVLILIGIGVVTQILSVSVLSGAAIHIGMGHHGMYMQFSPEGLAHGILLGICAAELIYGAVMYFVTALSLKRRLNLP